MDDQATTSADETPAFAAPESRARSIRLLAKSLKIAGVDLVFTSADGAGSMGDACRAEGIRTVELQHLQAAAYAANGYARISRKPGCVIVPRGAGMTGVLAGIVDAFRRESGMLVICGGGDLPYAEILRPVTKFCFEVNDEALVGTAVDEAVRRCQDCAPGPVYLEVSAGLPGGIVPSTDRLRDQTFGPSSTPDSDVYALEEVAASIIATVRPCILFGSQLRAGRATEAASEFCRKLNLPAYLAGSARGAFAPDDPYLFNHSRATALAAADLVIEIGCRPDEGAEGHVAAGGAVIKAGPGGWDPDEAERAALHIAGDCGAIMRSVVETIGYAEASGWREREPWLRQLREAELHALEALSPALRSGARPIHPLRLARELGIFIGGNTLVIDDAGIPAVTAAVAPSGPGLWFETGSPYVPGMGIPFALAAKLAHPEREILCLADEVSFAAMAFDIRSCIELSLPFISVVLSRSRDLSLGDLARTLGGYGEDIDDPDQIQPALQRARASGQCAVINIRIDPTPLSKHTL